MDPQGRKCTRFRARTRTRPFPIRGHLTYFPLLHRTCGVTPKRQGAPAPSPYTRAYSTKRYTDGADRRDSSVTPQERCHGESGKQAVVLSEPMSRRTAPSIRSRIVPNARFHGILSHHAIGFSSRTIRKPSRSNAFITFRMGASAGNRGSCQGALIPTFPATPPTGVHFPAAFVRPGGRIVLPRPEKKYNPG